MVFLVNTINILIMEFGFNNTIL